LDTSQSIKIEEEGEKFSYASKDKVVEDLPGVDTIEVIDNETIGDMADKSHINIKCEEHEALPHECEMDVNSSKYGGKSEATEDMDVAVPETQEPTTQEFNTNNRGA
jgi:hypothetical protein